MNATPILEFITATDPSAPRREREASSFDGRIMPRSTCHPQPTPPTRRYGPVAPMPFAFLHGSIQRWDVQRVADSGLYEAITGQHGAIGATLRPV